VNVYPTVRFATDSNPDYGPAEELYSVDVHVIPASEAPPAVMSKGEPSTPGSRYLIERERARLRSEAL
jgi:hypothetical protein